MTPVATARRIGAGARKPANWMQLFKFGFVGGSGYVVNLAVFAVLVEALDVHHTIGAVGAFCVAVSNNFYWNRHWTFRAGSGHAGFQAARFLTVSVAAFGIAFTMLEVLVLLGVHEVTAQAVAVVCATPVNFLGNRLWSFRLQP